MTVDSSDESSLRAHFTATGSDGKDLPLSPDQLRSGASHRWRTNYYRVPVWPQEDIEAISPAALHHDGAIQRVRQIAERTIPRLQERASIHVTPAARMLLDSSKAPIQSDLRATVDFSATDGTVAATLAEDTPDGPLPVADVTLLQEPHIAAGRFVELNPQAKERLRGLLALDPSCATGTIRFGQPAAPTALQIFRASNLTTESDTAQAVRVHDQPLEHRTYLELADPDTLIVRQNFAISDDRVIPDTTKVDEPRSDWLRVANEFFRLPARRPTAPQRGKRAGPGAYRVEGDGVPEFLADDLPKVSRASKVFVAPEVSEVRVVTAAPELRTTVDLDEARGEVVVQPRYHSGTADLEHTDLADLDRRRGYLRKGSSFHRVDWDLVDKVDRALKDAGVRQAPNGTFVAPSLHFDEIINTFSRLGILSEGDVFQRFRDRLLDFSKIEPSPLPTALKDSVNLRDYQRSGYDWLAFLKNYGLPGILADEMGLGKTLQALLAVAHFRDKYGFCPSLVVCPAALVQKWVDETGKFFRGLRGISHAGARRAEQLRENIGTADVIVTSYETLVRDADLLARWRWRFLIADEAQRVKNPGTQRAKAIRKVPAEARVAITGTPVENRLRDLWAVFDFLAPGYLGSESEFQRHFADPIERLGSRKAAELLIRRTHPFLLRRLKKHVASELPEKLPKPLRCDLTKPQRDLYRAVLERDLEAAIQAVGGRKLSLGNPHIFAVLARLKQICCHPGLISGDFQPYKSGISGKFDTFVEVLDEIVEGENGNGIRNKLVGFSQYVPMAGYLRDYVGSLGKACMFIDGSVPPGDRHGLCTQFNTTPDAFGMMMTLGAGGVGLDLQAANYVILYDRWWNPAVEDQAIDRVHRLGQERQVVVVTITTRGTLEEKIETKLEKKRTLSEQVIQADELMRKEISREDLLDLVRLE
jgi:superfamily II DNA or RNA helicase